MAIQGRQPDAAVKDAWVWQGPRFSARGAYGKLMAAEPPEDPIIVRRCQLIWSRRIPLKIKIFGWLLLRGRLMTRSLRQRFVLDAATDYALCSGAVEDCSHLFFECPSSQTVWRTAKIADVDFSSGEAFWRSLVQGTGRREAQWQTIFATLWAIWLHRNEVIFRGRPASSDAIQHEAGVLSRAWHLALARQDPT